MRRAEGWPAWPAAWAIDGRWLLMAGLLLCGLAPFARKVSSQLPHRPAHLQPGELVRGSTRELPREWDGRALRPLALSAVERRFAAHFPGRVARLTDGQAILVWRDVDVPTRMLHPAADCYRGLGYRIEHAALERDAQARLWRCFIAIRGSERQRVCERIEGTDGSSFTDASNWYWAAQLGRSRGPWQAITVARAL